MSIANHLQKSRKGFQYSSLHYVVFLSICLFLYSGVCSDLQELSLSDVIVFKKVPLEMLLQYLYYISIGTILNNFDVINRKINRKLQLIGTHSTVRKRTKQKENDIMETTNTRVDIQKYETVIVEPMTCFHHTSLIHFCNQ